MHSFSNSTLKLILIPILYTGSIGVNYFVIFILRKSHKQTLS